MAALDVTVLIETASVTDQHNRSVTQTVLDRLSKHLDEESRLGIFTYSDKTIENRPLEKVDESIMSMLSTARESGLLSHQIKNPVAALEKVIYGLRSNGRGGVTKIVLVLGNGEIATGNQIRDQELTKWLLEDLSEEIKQSQINLYWLAFSENADFRIIQTITRKTKGAYYRAFTPEDAIFSIDAIMTAVNGAANQSSGSNANNTNVFAGLIDRAESGMLILKSDYGVAILAISFVLLTTVATGIGIVRSKKARSNRLIDPIANRDQRNTKVILRDLAGFTALKEYDITDKMTYIGRLPREVTENSTVVVIRDATVGREHAIISPRDGAYWLLDKGTVNGTYLNHQRLNAEARLHDGDRVRFARFEFEIMLPTEEVTRGVDQHTGDSAKQSIRIVEVNDYDDQDKTIYRNQ